MGIIAAATAAIIAQLEPLLASSSANPHGDLKVIETRIFSADQEVDEILGKFRDITPAGFINIPDVSFTQRGASGRNYRKLDATLTYRFAVTQETQRDTSAKSEFIDKHFDLFVNRMVDKIVADAGLAALGCKMDSMTLLDGRVIEDPKMAAFIFAFAARFEHTGYPF